MRILALYLPQFHRFKENDAWWGEGYTEWTAVKRAKPVFKGHMEPRVPVEGYYDLSEETAETLKRQAENAGKYGIYGFSFYQYWFLGHKLMEKPMEILLKHPEIDINYTICWANETWTRTWYGKSEEVLIAQEYGDEKNWEEHISYLLQFFKDPRYIKINNAPILQIYRSFDIDCLSEMRSYFEKRLREEGFDGLYLVSGLTAGKKDDRKNLIDAYYCFEPGYSLKHGIGKVHTLFYNARVAFFSMINKLFKTELLERVIPIDWIFDAVCKRDYAPDEFPGVIARWDNTPRRGYKGLVYKGATPEKFGKVLRVLKEKVNGRSEDFVFINAFNEWGEGAMLEADEAEGYAYLEAVREADSQL